MSGFDLTLWVITPISGAIIGYFTNWLAIKMLFRPLYEKRIFGIRVPLTPGLIPKERHRISQKLAETISTHLLTEQVIAQALSSEKTFEGINEIINSVFMQLENNPNTIEYYAKLFLKDKYSEEMVGQYIKRVLAKMLPGLIQNLREQINDNEYFNDVARILVTKLIENNAGKILGIFLNPDKIYESMKKSIVEYLNDDENQDKIYVKLCEFIDMAPNSELKEVALSLKVSELMSKYAVPHKEKILDMIHSVIKPLIARAAAYAANTINIEQIVIDQMNAFGLSDAEKIIISVVDKELRAITIVGGVLGFAIGLLPATLKLFGL